MLSGRAAFAMPCHLVPCEGVLGTVLQPQAAVSREMPGEGTASRLPQLAGHALLIPHR